MFKFTLKSLHISDKIMNSIKSSFETWLANQPDPNLALSYIRNDYKTENEEKLEEFSSKARELVPLDIKTLPNEKDGVKTKMVDSFLYPDEILDDWVENGEFSRTYCKKYPDEEVTNFNFMSDSFSIEELSWLFGNGAEDGRLLGGKTEGKQLLDIGSRFGAAI